MTFSPDQDSGEELLPILRKEATPVDEDEQRWGRFTRGAYGFWKKWVAGWGWDQVDRLKEAKLLDIESMSGERRATAAAQMAEARRRDAEAELLYAQAEEVRLSNAEKRLQIKAAYERLEQTVQAIENKGGRIYVDEPRTAELSPSGDADALEESSGEGP